MKLTKFTHSCVRIEKDDRVLVLDPGTFSEVETALEGADFLLVTHAHPDHFDAERVNAYLAEHPEVKVYAPAAVADQVREAAPSVEVTTVEGEESFSLGNFEVKTFGGQHALIHPLIKTIDNVAFLIDENVYHPGDSLVVPHGLKVKTLLVPIHAPWSKIQETIDFVISVRAKVAFPIHNGLINSNGHGIMESQITDFGAKYGTEYKHLESGESVEV